MLKNLFFYKSLIFFSFICSPIFADHISFTSTSKQFVKGLEPDGLSPIIFDKMTPTNAPFTLSGGSIVVNNQNLYYYRFTVNVEAIGPMNTQPIAYLGFETDGTIINNFTGIFPQPENPSAFGRSPVTGSGSFTANNGTTIRLLNLSSVGISVLPFNRGTSAELELSLNPFQ